MRRVRLIHWNAAEAKERATRLREAGFVADHAVPAGLAFLAAMARRPPDAVVIDLGRLPSQGRDVAFALRARRGTRAIPIVFVGGEREKVAGIRRMIPDAAYTSWKRIGAAIERAAAHPPRDPVPARSALDAYAGRPLPKKLGIRPGLRVALAGAPEGARAALGTLPGGVTVRDALRGRFDLVLWFVSTRRELDRRVAVMARRPDFKWLWILWPKKASGAGADLGEAEVRRAGLAADLVDFKVISFDATWSGLCFARRKERKESWSTR